MKKYLYLLLLFCIQTASAQYLDASYGTPNNFKVINPTGTAENSKLGINVNPTANLHLKSKIVNDQVQSFTTDIFDEIDNVLSVKIGYKEDNILYGVHQTSDGIGENFFEDLVKIGNTTINAKYNGISLKPNENSFTIEMSSDYPTSVDYMPLKIFEKGIIVNESVESNQKFVIGTDFNNCSSYLGFNAHRKRDNSWELLGNSSNNGGTVIYSHPTGDLIFSVIGPEGSGGGTGDRPSLSDQEIINNNKMIITSLGKVGIGTMNPAYSLDIYNQDLPATLRIKSGIFAGFNLATRNADFVTRTLDDGYTYITNSYQGSSYRAMTFFNSSILLGEMGSEDWMNYRLAVSGNLLCTQKVRIGENIDESRCENYLLAVKGSIICHELKVRLYDAPWPDFVFEDDYVLPSLYQVEKFIKENKHLEDIPTASDVENGLNVSEINTKLLKKVEELTLYIIQQQKEIDELKRSINH